MNFALVVFCVVYAELVVLVVAKETQLAHEIKCLNYTSFIII